MDIKPIARLSVVKRQAKIKTCGYLLLFYLEPKI